LTTAWDREQWTEGAVGKDTVELKPAELLVKYWPLLAQAARNGPVLDLACGAGRNLVFLACKGLQVVGCDRSEQALREAQRLASLFQVEITLWRVDLEEGRSNSLPEEGYGGIIVFRYLHRPLIPCIGKAVQPGGILLYETYTIEQTRFGKPHNPDFLLRPGELRDRFSGWNVLHSFEGIVGDPPRAIAQFVGRKPIGRQSGEEDP
jgi:tellurite methyltransferase